MDISEKLKRLPESSGVYIMLDKDGNIIYIGKAKVLKNRVRQYFHKSEKPPKVEAMISHIADFRYIMTPSETDALVLESNLIKKHKPQYNILLKDDKNYPFIKIDMTAEYPKMEIVRRLSPDKAKYYGPFMQGISVKDIMEMITTAYPVRTCNYDLVKNKPKRPCLNYHIGRCIAPCTEAVDSVRYKEIMSQVINFFEGDDSMKDVLQKKMEEASEREDFESAISYRDKLAVLDKVIRNQIAAIPRAYNADVFSYATDGIFSAVGVLSVRSGRMLGGNNITVNDADINDGAALSSFIMQYYQDKPLPDVILTNIQTEDALSDALMQAFSHRASVTTPQKGFGVKLVEMAEKNARYYIEQTVKREKDNEEKRKSALQILGEALGIPAPKRMECFDISNVSGTDKVASMVVFENGDKLSSHYRRFKIKTVEGANDFACMAEVITRRMRRYQTDKDVSFSTRPDLIIVDGGKGQLSYALAALEKVGEKVNIVGLAEENEELFLPHKSDPITLPRDSLALYLVQRIRDEAHRFAITYHRSLRAERMTRSALLGIKGVGEKKIKILYKELKTLDAIREADEQKLASIKGISTRDAAAITKFFQTHEF